MRILDEAGEVVAVADGRYAFGSDLILGLGSNFFTTPDRRGAGLAAAIDLSTRDPFVERTARRLGRSAELPRLVAADVDPYDPDVPESLARLRLWGRCGWKVVPPAALPFALLGQEDPARPGELLRPVPNLLMVRGYDGLVLDALPRGQLTRTVDLLEAMALGLAPEADVRAWARLAREALAAWPDNEVRLLPMTPDGCEALTMTELFRR